MLASRRLFPFITLSHAISILRVSTAVFFMAHAVVRLYNGTLPQFAAFLSDRGWPAATALVWLITLYEIVAGTLLICNRQVRWAALGMFAIALMGIVIIHASLGWFVGEHGTGGMEYSFSLMAALLVVAAADGERKTA